MLYHIGTLFQNWLFLPLPSHLLITLLNSIIICTNFYALLSTYLGCNQYLPCYFVPFAFARNFIEKKTQLQAPQFPVSDLSVIVSFSSTKNVDFFLNATVCGYDIHWIQKHNYECLGPLILCNIIFYPFFLSFFNCLQMHMLQVSSPSKPAWSAALTTVL